MEEDAFDGDDIGGVVAVVEREMKILGHSRKVIWGTHQPRPLGLSGTSVPLKSWPNGL